MPNARARESNRSLDRRRKNGARQARYRDMDAHPRYSGRVPAAPVRNSLGEVSLFAGEPTRDGRQRTEQLARRLERDQAPEQIAANCRQMIDVYVTAAGAKFPRSTRGQGKVFR